MKKEKLRKSRRVLRRIEKLKRKKEWQTGSIKLRKTLSIRKILITHALISLESSNSTDLNLTLKRDTLRNTKWFTTLMNQSWTRW